MVYLGTNIHRTLHYQSQKFYTLSFPTVQWRGHIWRVLSYELWYLDNLVPVDILTGWIRRNYSGFLPLGTFIAFYRFSKLFSEFAQPREIVVKLSINKEQGAHWVTLFKCSVFMASKQFQSDVTHTRIMSKKSITLQKQ